MPTNSRREDFAQREAARARRRVVRAARVTALLDAGQANPGGRRGLDSTQTHRPTDAPQPHGAAGRESRSPRRLVGRGRQADREYPARWYGPADPIGSNAVPFSPSRRSSHSPDRRSAVDVPARHGWRLSPPRRARNRSLPPQLRRTYPPSSEAEPPPADRDDHQPSTARRVKRKLCARGIASLLRSSSSGAFLAP